MRAAEARALAKKGIAIDQRQYENIMISIRAACAVSVFSIWYHDDIAKYVYDKLVADGYNIENHSTQHDGTTFRISWRDTDDIDPY